MLTEQERIYWSSTFDVITEILSVGMQVKDTSRIYIAWNIVGDLLKKF
jgi:hypothetical protein